MVCGCSAAHGHFADRRHLTAHETSLPKRIPWSAVVPLPAAVPLSAGALIVYQHPAVCSFTPFIRGSLLSQLSCCRSHSVTCGSFIDAGVPWPAVIRWPAGAPFPAVILQPTGILLPANILLPAAMPLSVSILEFAAAPLPAVIPLLCSSPLPRPCPQAAGKVFLPLLPREKTPIAHEMISLRGGEHDVPFEPFKRQSGRK